MRFLSGGRGFPPFVLLSLVAFAQEIFSVKTRAMIDFLISTEEKMYAAVDLQGGQTD
jgi:hypothetical protein